MGEVHAAFRGISTHSRGGGKKNGFLEVKNDEKIISERPQRST
jgi:hypothetical protein